MTRIQLVSSLVSGWKECSLTLLKLNLNCNSTYASLVQEGYFMLFAVFTFTLMSVAILNVGARFSFITTCIILCRNGIYELIYFELESHSNGMA